jgi:predicted deacylase
VTTKFQFPADYRSARMAFIAAAEAAELGITSRLLAGIKGVDGGPLFLDTAWAGRRDAKKALLLISGTHGVEGYFGSGVQITLLHQGLSARIPRDSKIVLLHALNPYGFSFDRRVNEDNADVNRNFVDHTNPPANPEYDLLAEAAAPKDISPEAFAVANKVLTAFGNEHGSFRLQAALSRGQYRHPDGIYYGGAKLSWSLRMLKDVLDEELKDVEELTVIDFHTGLGEFGAAEIITEAEPGSEAYERAYGIWGSSLRSTASGQSLSAHLHGTIDSAMATWMGTRPLSFVALEVGTRSVSKVFEALRKDNWLSCHAPADFPHRAQIKRQIRDAFYPEEEDWKAMVFAHGKNAVAMALAVL